MRRLFLLFIIVFLTFSAVSVSAAAYKDYFQDDNFFREKPEVLEVIKERLNFNRLNAPISKIKYIVDLGQKEKSRSLVSDIFVKTYIDAKNNFAIDIIKAHFYVEKRKRLYTDKKGVKTTKEYPFPDFVGQIFTLEILGWNKNRGGMKNARIVMVKAPGWKIIDSDPSTFVYLKNYEYKEYFSDYIRVVVEIQNQDKFKGREFEIFNRNFVNFESTFTIEDGFEFSRFDPDLPFELKPKDKALSPEDYINLKKDSIIISEQIIRDRIHFQAWLKGDDYLGNNIYGGLKPKKVINFSCSFDYQEDLNAKIVEENRNSTGETLNKIREESKKSAQLALILFSISIFVSILATWGKGLKLYFGKKWSIVESIAWRSFLWVVEKVKAGVVYLFNAFKKRLTGIMKR